MNLYVRATALIALLFCALPLCAATYTVTNTNATGAGSLDAAITSANGDVAADTIQFAIPGAGVHTIIPTGSYVISSEMVIDATTQPGYAGAPLIEIDGNSSVADLFFVMSEATIRGFSLTGYLSTAIVISATAGDTVISANYIGLEPNGTTADGAIVGVRVADNASSGETHLIGGSTVADRNVIAGNNLGIEVANSTTALVSVQGNFIGTTAAGTATAANGTGIRVRTYNAVEVGTVASNTIAFNGIGTEVLEGPAEILSNSFFSNTTGIVVAGGNPGEFPPTLSTAVSNAVSTRITGSLAVPLEPGTLYRLQFFSNPVSEVQGRSFVGETTVTTDGAGNASFDVTFPVSVPAGQFVTATATNTPEAETSAFAQDIVVTALVANLSLSKTTTSTTVTTGQTISYTITVTNNGPDSATGVTITDNLPGNTSFVSATPTQGSCSGSTTVTCSIGTLANGASATVTLQVQASSLGSAVNSASATGNESDPDGANATASAVTVVGPTANLSLTKTTAATTVTVGQSIGYTITVTNNGPGTATGVTITDTIPANTAFVSATPSQGSCSGTTTVTCTIGTLSNGSSATVALQVVATGPGSTVNSASATGNETDPDGANATAPAVTVTGATLAAVPTLSVWAMILMGLAIAFVAIRTRL
jgi:uncharacterized repeat protein (TIGR01451 family)